MFVPSFTYFRTKIWTGTRDGPREDGGRGAREAEAVEGWTGPKKWTVSLTWKEGLPGLRNHQDGNLPTSKDD